MVRIQIQIPAKNAQGLQKEQKILFGRKIK